MRKILFLALLLVLIPIQAFSQSPEREVRGYFGIAGGDTDDKGPTLVINPDGSINVVADIDLQGATIEGGGTSSAFGAAFPADGTAIGCSAGGNMVACGTTTNPLIVGDGTGPLTIDGTVTANLSATDNAVLDNIDTSASRLLSSAGPKAAGSALATTAFQVGGTYLASQPTMTDGQEAGLQLDEDGNLRVNVMVGGAGGGGSQYTEGDTDPTITGTALLFEGGSNTLVAAPGTAANGLLVDVSRVTGTVTVSGTVTANLGATDNAVLDDIADGIPITGSVTPGTGATNLGKAIGGAAGATDTGVAPLAVRDDALTTLSDPEGDWVPLRVDSTGALHVTGAGGGTQFAEDSALGSTPTGTLAMCRRDDALATLTPVEDDAIGCRVDSRGALWVAWSNPLTPTMDGVYVIGNTDHDASASGIDPVLVGGFASAAAPTSVSADGDAVNAWFLRNGAQATVLTAAGALIGGDATNGLDVDVTRLPAIPAGNNNIGDVDIASIAAGNNNIGDVDVASIVPGTGATNLGKAVDGASGGTDTGVAILAIRDDSLSALTPVEGDYVQLRVNSTGALHVTGGGGGTQYNIDDVASATATGTFALVVRKDSAASLAGTDGDVTGLQVDANGALRVTGGGGGTEYAVNAVAPADPTGATFVMERDDAITALTEVEGDWTNPRSTAEGALWTQDFNSDTMVTHLATVAGAVSGTEMQVDVLTLPSVTIGTFPDNEPFNVAQMNGVTVLMGAGNTGTGSQRVTEATDSQLSAGVGATGDAAATAGSTGSLNAKLRLMSQQLEDLKTAAQLIDDDQTAGSLNYHTSTGTTEDETEIKGTAGRVLGVIITNTNAAARYFRCYNLTAANTTPGTSTVHFGWAIPGNTAGSGTAFPIPSGGIPFSTALTCTLTTGAADTDVAEVAANEIKWTIIYK